MKNQEVKEALSGLLSDIAHYDDKYCEDDIRSWLMAATLRIWAGNRLFSEDYVNVLPVFKEQDYTIAQVVTALDCAGDESREMDIPMFFQNIVRKDIETYTSESRTIADSIGRFLVLAALINGDFTMDEANALRDISDLLLGYCDHQGVAAGKSREYHPEMVTPLSQTGYYQPAADEKKKSVDNEKKAEQVNPLSSNNPPAPKPEEVVPTITLNLNLVPEQPAEPTVSAPASGVTVKKPASNGEGSEEILESVLDAQLLEKYIELARNVTKPEENESYPEKVRHSAAIRALYDNTGCDADLAAALHAAVMRSKMDRFRNAPVKERRIKRELLKILKSKDEVERVFKIIVEQEEY